MQKIYRFGLESILRFLLIGLLLVLFYRISTSKSYAAGWTQIVGLGSHVIGAVVDDPNNPNILYAGTDNLLYKSTDGGNTWTNYTNGLPTGNNKYMTGLVINPANPNIL